MRRQVGEQVGKRVQVLGLPHLPCRLNRHAISKIVERVFDCFTSTGSRQRPRVMPEEIGDGLAVLGGDDALCRASDLAHDL
jgi:hypothetical protein